MTRVNWPPRGADRVTVVGTGVADPWAQLGTQLSTSEVPCPTALAAVHALQVMWTTTFVPSPLKKMVRGRIPEYEPAVRTGSGVPTTLWVAVVEFEVALVVAEELGATTTVLVAVTVRAACVELPLEPQPARRAAAAAARHPMWFFLGSPRIVRTYQCTPRVTSTNARAGADTSAGLPSLSPRAAAESSNSWKP